MAASIGTLQNVNADNFKLELEVFPQVGKSPNKPRLFVVTPDKTEKIAVSKVMHKAFGAISPQGNDMSYLSFNGVIEHYGDVTAIVYYSSLGAINRSDYSVAYYSDGKKVSLKQITDAIANKGGF